jgi:hypothetical protein
MDSRAERIMSLWDGLSRTQRQRAAEHLEEEMKGALVSSAQDTTNLTAASAQQLIQDLTLAHEPWLLVDIPGERRGSEIPLHYVREAQGRSLRKDLRVAGSPQPSEAWEKYAGGLRLAAGKVRVYCRPDLLETVESSITIERGMESVIASLERASSGRRGD